MVGEEGFQHLVISLVFGFDGELKLVYGDVGEVVGHVVAEAHFAVGLLL